MKHAKRHPLIFGTIILTATGLITRVIGFFYRIYLSRLFGEEGMGIYQLLSPALSLSFSLTAAGYQTAISKYVAADSAKRPSGVFTAAKEADGVKVIGCDVDQYDDGANGDSNIVLTSGLKVMHDTVYNVLNEVKDGSFKGANVTLTAADDATGFVSEEGRCQLTAEAIEKINAAQALLKEGKIVPAANFNGVTPETFTW